MLDAEDALEDADEVVEDGLVGTGVLRPFLLLNKTAVLRLTPAGEGVCTLVPRAVVSFDSVFSAAGDAGLDCSEVLFFSPIIKEYQYY